MRTELETLNWVRKLMKPLPASVDKTKLWIAGRKVNAEEFILISLRQKVLRKIEKLEKL